MFYLAGFFLGWAIIFALDRAWPFAMVSAILCAVFTYIGEGERMERERR